MAKYFTIKELTYSATARKYGIDNTPNETVLQHMEELMDFMDGAREKWGSALIVTSGYRCEELNTRVDGAKTSAHKSGYAMDIVPANNKKVEFFEFMKEYLQDKEFDELLLEKSAKSIWIHFALKSSQGKQRRKIRTLQVQ